MCHYYVLNMSILWNNHGRFNWLGKLSILLISAWLLTIILSINHIYMNNSGDMNENQKEIDERLKRLTNSFQLLKKQNYFLRNIIIRHDSHLIQKKNVDILNNKIDSDPSYYDLFKHYNILNNSLNEPSLSYEEIRRKIRNNVQEIGYFIHGQLNKVKLKSREYDLITEITTIIDQFDEHRKLLVTNIDKLSEVDGYKKWREKEALQLSNLIQKRFRHLQNPKDCNSAKKLLCHINKGCGFGCQIHHVVYCFLVAYGTERTLILKSKGWRYQKDGWESVFKPLSKTCTSSNHQAHVNWPGDLTKEVIVLPIVDNVYPKPIYQPPSVPADIALKIEKIHGYPLVWWIGQVLKYIMRPNDHTNLFIENKKKKMKFKNPIVGVHIRRTDKIGTEAAFHEIEEYMLKVQQYYNSLEDTPKIKRVYLASDDPKVITTTKQRYSEYDIIADTDIAQTASISRRYSNLSLHGIIIDIHFLSLCDYLVCTFSSQVCRVAYELMQTYHPDAHNKFASLDDIYYYGGQNPHAQITIVNHIPKREGEIELKINDQVEVFGNHWNGYSKGRNLRTGVIGLFPSFKVKSTTKTLNFPNYEKNFQ